MFTGLVEEVGTLRSLTRNPRGAHVEVVASFSKELARGDSIAVEGACLTAVDLTPTSFTAEISNESLARTTLGELKAGSSVNLERALQAGARLGGHYVLGHVDGVGRIASVTGLGDAKRVDIEFPPEMAPLFVEKGSVCIDGISLTINEVGPKTFWVALIPETQQRTTLPRKTVGARVNLEGDIIGKYVLRSLALAGRGQGITEAFLAKNGYT